MTSLHYYLFLCLFFFVFFSRTDRFFQSFMSSLFLSFLLKTNFIFHKNLFFFDFHQKLGEGGKKSFLLALSLCRSRQILDCICRPIEDSQLTPHVEVRLTCLPSNIHVFLFKQISCLQSVVCEYIPLYYGLFFFHYVCFESFVLSSFENVIVLECDVIFAICAVFMAVVVLYVYT